MWRMEFSPEYLKKSRAKDWQKKYSREFVAVHANTGKVFSGVAVGWEA